MKRYPKLSRAMVLVGVLVGVLYLLIIAVFYPGRLSRLEWAGELPQTATPPDRRLAETTSWWGKRLDPKAFWKDKPIWLDTNAKVAANNHGRLFPPIPVGEQKFSSYPDKDMTDRSGVAEGESIAYYQTEREGAFWNDFVLTHPRPPEDLEREQIEVESAILSCQKSKQIRQNDLKILQGSLRDSAISLNYPPEALTDDALHWAYVVHQNQQYQHDIQIMPLEVAQAVARNSGSDLTQLTNSLSSGQVTAANAWKVAYLQRLRREKVDKQYITASLKAWGLSSNEVFGAGN